MAETDCATAFDDDEPYIRPDVAQFLAAAAAIGAPPLESLPVAEARTRIAALGNLGDLPPLPLPVVRDLACPGPAGPIALRLYQADAAAAAGPLIVYYHGGGFVFGDLASHDSFCRWLATRTRLPVLAVDYRLAPEHPWPAFAEDAEAAARWAAGNPPELGLAVTALVTCGDSAGGHCAVLVAQRLALQPAAVPVAAQWAFYPYLGDNAARPSMLRYAEGFMLSQAAMAWFDAQVAAPAGDPAYQLLAGLIPPTPLALQVATLDPLRDQGIAYAEQAEAAGVRVITCVAEGMIHGYVTLRAALPSAVEDCEALVSAGLELLRAGPFSADER